MLARNPTSRTRDHSWARVLCRIPSFFFFYIICKKKNSSRGESPHELARRNNLDTAARLQEKFRSLRSDTWCKILHFWDVSTGSEPFPSISGTFFCLQLKRKKKTEEGRKRSTAPSEMIHLFIFFFYKRIIRLTQRTT